VKHQRYPMDFLGDAADKVAEALREDPNLLFSSPKLASLREVLSQYGELKAPGTENTSDPSVEQTVENNEDDDEFDDDDDERLPNDAEPFPAIPEGGEDHDGAALAKEAATDAKSNGDYDKAVQKYTEAMTLGSVSAITLANRADCLLKLKKPCAAINDCAAALKLNPDSAKALRCRGKCYRFIGEWELALKDLAAAQTIDFDPDTADLVKLVTTKVSVLEAKKTAKRVKEEDKIREKLLKKKADIEKSRREAEEEEKARKASQQSSGSGGMPGGMPGMGGGGGGMQEMMMQMLMQDPELAAGMQNPKVMAAMQKMMQGDMSAMGSDPEVLAFMQKIQKKLGGLGGMGGMGGMGGFGASSSGAGGRAPNFYDMPGVEEVD